jgi:LasA protease
MKFSRSLRLLACALAAAFSTIVCSSGYITPDSVQLTQQALDALASATAFQLPTLAPTSEITLTPTLAISPTSEVQATATPLESSTPGAPFLYTAQSGDTLAALASRFGVDPSAIASPQDIPAGLIPAGQIFNIPNIIGVTTSNVRLLPDSEVIFSPSAADFHAASFADPFGGYLATYREYLPSQWYSGSAVITRVAVEHSLNPRLLLSVLQQQSNWVLGEPSSETATEYPMGMIDSRLRGLYQQLTWAAKQLSIGYYGWREGGLTTLTFRDGQTLRIAPDLNAGTVAVQYLFSQLYDYEGWLDMMDTNVGFPFTHKAMFPDPAIRASQTEPLFPPELTQPNLSLPFFNNQIWYFTGGPHGAWEPEGSLAALDFAPSSSLPGCVDSEQWITAAAPGLVVRTATGVVVVDMDGDGNEQTGWVLLYLHVAGNTFAHAGDWVDRGDRIGHPSCEGGSSTGTHLHIARKYNGEWIAAGGPVPFVLSGWTAVQGDAPYQGSLVRDERTIIACTCSNSSAQILRSPDDPY